MSFRCTCPGLGVSPDCLAHMYDSREDEPECSGLCLSGHDIGLSSNTVAHPHPDCDRHGRWSHLERQFEQTLSDVDGDLG